MKIKKIAFGDNSLSFIEDRLSDGFNIIYSDDNNKGKTIVMQSALYALGNEPIFPASFNYQDYYHYVEVELENGEILSCCRKKSSFVVLLMDSISLFDSISDLKRFFNKNGIVFPTIIKNNVKRMVDPVLLYQLFFVGQDGKDTSKIFNEGFYKKDDFRNLVFSFMGFKPIINSDLNEIELKNKIVKLKEQKKVLLDKNEILKKNTPALNVLFQNSDARNFEEKIKKANNINDQIAELSKQRNRALTRKAKNEKTLKELKSLNRTEKSGSLVCLDCNSKNIGYISGDRSYTFDISNEIMRNNILVSIYNRIEAYQEEISDCSSKINELQIQLQNVIKDDDVSLEHLLFYKNETESLSDIDEKLTEINKDLKLVEEQIKNIKVNFENDEKQKKVVFNTIINTMNEYYKNMDPDGTLIFDDLFTKKKSVFSGCEETEFYLSRLYSLKKVLNHQFPIMMDYFRDGELSSDKENYVLNTFKQFIDTQIIFTATLKNEEMNKYDKYKFINQIDYSTNHPSHILSAKNNSDFRELLKKLMILFD